ncbi:uncharacterized protein LOC101739144 isoform X2 [Bombyx mori]|uniref:Temptin n=1 Tax=Bombyx mori TaxID=7091 RepID=A0A8R2LWX3_BOMMO|nr:uncharacterized protein LOC101739144 isoform X2 [Bombyx mori]
MKYFIVIFCLVSLVCSKSFGHHPATYGWDDYYLNGNFNPGKRCLNMWDDGCANGQLPGAGNDDYYLGGGFNPGKRCVNMWDEGCINDQINGAGNDDYYLNNGFNPGKRSVIELFKKLHKTKPKL